jgi:hypothetical protein
VSREQHQHSTPIPPLPLHQNGQVIEYIYGGLPRPPDLTGKEERTTIGCRRGEIRVTQKLHMKKLDFCPLSFTF